jgi:hypothetical protein
MGYPEGLKIFVEGGNDLFAKYRKEFSSIIYVSKYFSQAFKSCVYVGGERIHTLCGSSSEVWTRVDEDRVLSSGTSTCDVR